jgi:hypothetical protein
MLPPSQRKFLNNTVESSSAWLKTGLSFGGKALWIVSTSVLLAVVPWALAYAEDQQMAEMEREMKMQQSASEVSYTSAFDADEIGEVLMSGLLTWLSSCWLPVLRPQGSKLDQLYKHCRHLELSAYMGNNRNMLFNSCKHGFPRALRYAIWCPVRH